ncbi:carbonic anhydrase, partial [Mycobacteroides abscessus]
GAADRSVNALTRWLDFAQDSLTAYQQGHAARASAAARGFGDADQLGVVNVAIQVERLMRHPILVSAVRSGRVRVIGTFFDIAQAHVYLVDRDG